MFNYLKIVFDPYLCTNTFLITITNVYDMIYLKISNTYDVSVIYMYVTFYERVSPDLLYGYKRSKLDRQF